MTGANGSSKSVGAVAIEMGDADRCCLRLNSICSSGDRAEILKTPPAVSLDSCDSGVHALGEAELGASSRDVCAVAYCDGGCGGARFREVVDPWIKWPRAVDVFRFDEERGHVPACDRWPGRNAEAGSDAAAAATAESAVEGRIDIAGGRMLTRLNDAPSEPYGDLPLPSKTTEWDVPRLAAGNDGLNKLPSRGLSSFLPLGSDCDFL